MTHNGHERSFVASDLFGIPRDGLADFKRWSLAFDDIFGMPFPTIQMFEDCLDAINGMNKIFREQLAARRREPQNDLLSVLIQARDENDVLSEDEILSSCQTIMFAGHKTTASMLCNGLAELIRHPSEWAKLRDDPSLMSSAIDEL